MPSMCDACGATGTTLAKVSLSRDFFGRMYDRLTPSSDRSPAWYCPSCSEEKRMQLDCRTIEEALAALAAAEASPLAEPGTLTRALDRLRAIAARLRAGHEDAGGRTPYHGHLLSGARVEALQADLERRAAGTAP